MNSSLRIEGALFVLRPWTLDDIPALLSHADNPRVAENLRDHFPNPYTVQDAVAFITIVAAKNPGRNFAIEVDGQAVGGVGFVPGADVERLSAEVGYWLGEEFWGRGIVTAAVKALCAHIFANTDIIRLWAGVYAYNKASQRVMEKARFTHLTTMHRAAIKNGEIIDLEYYELLK